MDPMTMMLLSMLGSAGAGAIGGMAGQNKGSYDQISTLTPEQQEMMSQLMPQLMQGQQLGMDWINQILSGGDEAFSKFEAPFKRQFEQETMPGIAERFAGMGSGGAQSSSAMNQSMGQAGRELSENLASLRSNLQQSAMSQLQGMTGMAMQPQFTSMYNQPQMGVLGGAAKGIAPGMSMMGGLSGLKAMGIG